MWDPAPPPPSRTPAPPRQIDSWYRSNRRQPPARGSVAWSRCPRRPPSRHTSGPSCSPPPYRQGYHRRRPLRVAPHTSTPKAAQRGAAPAKAVPTATRVALDPGAAGAAPPPRALIRRAPPPARCGPTLPRAGALGAPPATRLPPPARGHADCLWPQSPRQGGARPGAKEAVGARGGEGGEAAAALRCGLRLLAGAVAALPVHHLPKGLSKEEAAAHAIPGPPHGCPSPT